MVMQFNIEWRNLA